MHVLMCANNMDKNMYTTRLVPQHLLAHPQPRSLPSPCLITACLTPVPQICLPLLFYLMPITPHTGLLLTILQWSGLLPSSTAYQNFLVTLEMLPAAILLRFAFPYKFYMGLRKDDQGRGIPMKKITSHFKDTLNPHDVVDDAIHNFSRVYQEYAQQGDMSEDGSGAEDGGRTVGINKDGGSDEEAGGGVSVAASPGGGGGRLSKLIPSAAKKRKSGGFERVTLLVESDEDEIM